MNVFSHAVTYTAKPFVTRIAMTPHYHCAFGAIGSSALPIVFTVLLWTLRLHYLSSRPPKIMQEHPFLAPAEIIGCWEQKNVRQLTFVHSLYPNILRAFPHSPMLIIPFWVIKPLQGAAQGLNILKDRRICPARGVTLGSICGFSFYLIFLTLYKSHIFGLLRSQISHSTPLTWCTPGVISSWIIFSSDQEAICVYLHSPSSPSRNPKRFFKPMPLWFDLQKLAPRYISFTQAEIR